ncbi:MAG: ABC transporter permease [Terracidiphilus sp.]|jgi:putative ABC transport system permease protein
MNKLIFANLLHRPLRSIISIFAVAIEVIMMLTIIAIMLGQLTGQKRMNNGIGADLIVRASNAMIFNGINGAVIPVKLEGILRALPHVAVATPVNQKLSMIDGLEVLWGIEYPTYSQLSPFVFISGGPPQKPDDVIVDDVFASTGKGHHVGETILVEKRPFRITGIFEHGKGGRKLIPIETMDDITGTPEKASAFYLKADQPENIALIAQEIHAVHGLEDYQVMTMEEWYSLMTPDHIPGLNIALRVVIGIAVIIGFMVIFQSMYTSVLERTREIGILKSMGASNLTIVSVVLRETALLAVAGVVLGVVISAAIKSTLAHWFPGLYLDMNLRMIIQGAAIAFVGSVCGAFYPAWMAARKDPIDALAYE